MKKKQFTGKLNLNKESISRLQDGQMHTVIGGNGSGFCTGSCLTRDQYCIPPTDTGTEMTLCNQITCASSQTK